MAYSKRLWKGRQGTGLNKFSINGATPVTVVNQPDSVTEQGDALSAGNLNDLEDRIYDAFDDIADGTQIVGKATADASGNVITTTYATKSELTSEATARANADSNLLSAIQANSARISNLEQEHGGYVTVNYRGDNAVPPNKAKYALVESIVGKSRAWNQLVLDGNFPDTSNWAKNGNGTFTASSNIATFTPAQQSANIASAEIKTVIGHKYLLSCRIKLTTGTTSVVMRLSGDTSIAKATENTTGWQTLTVIGAATASSSRFQIIDARASDWDSIQITDCIIRDLTLIFPEGVPATVAECVAKCPDLLKYDAYGYSLPSTTVSGICTTSINILDEVWEAGRINGSDGELVSDSTALRTKNFIPVNSNTDYYVMCSTAMMHLAWYDVGKNYISGNRYASSNSKRTSPANAFYLKFSTDSNYGSTFKDDLQICLDSVSEKTIYHPHILATLTLPTSVTLRSAGSVADTDELNVEVNGVAKRRQTTRIDSSIINGTTTWSYTHDQGSFAWFESTNFTGAKPSGAIISSRFKYGASSTDEGLQLLSNGQIRLSILKSRLSEVSTIGLVAYFTSNPLDVNYELATESVTLSDPISNDMIQTEGGGTINTIQNNVYPDDSPAPVIDNCLDVGYLAL